MISLRIEDGTGSGSSAKVSTTNKLLAESESAPRDFFVSRDDGQVFAVQSEDAATAANEETLYLQNTSTDKDLIIDDVIICADAATKFRLKFVTGTAAGSSALTATNLNKSSSNSAAIIARGDGAVTGLTDDGDIAIISVAADDTQEIKLDEALRLGQDDAIAVESEGIANVAMTVEFHFE